MTSREHCWMNSAVSTRGQTVRSATIAVMKIDRCAMNKLLQQFEAEQITRQLPDFGPGDTVIVNVKVKEGNRERVQAFEGIVIAKRSRGLHSAFTVRKISHGTGVERVFQSHSR